MKACDIAKLTGDCELKDLLVKKGLSSSVTISVTMAAAVDLALNCLENPEGLFKDCDGLTKYASLAYMGENKVLGINRGQTDQYASVYEGFLFIDCHCEPVGVKRLNPKIEIPLVIDDTGQSKNTLKILAWPNKRFRYGMSPNRLNELIKAALDVGALGLSCLAPEVEELW
jgi:mevalonate kinase